jgi:antitoxin ParD1/3/4
MATMNVSLPDAMKDWVEGRAQTGRYSNASDYVRDLIRRDQERESKLAALQRRIEEGEDSGVSPLSAGDVLANARRRVGTGGRDL